MKKELIYMAILIVAILATGSTDSEEYENIISSEKSYDKYTVDILSPAPVMVSDKNTEIYDKYLSSSGKKSMEYMSSPEEHKMDYLNLTDEEQMGFYRDDEFNEGGSLRAGDTMGDGNANKVEPTPIGDAPFFVFLCTIAYACLFALRRISPVLASRAKQTSKLSRKSLDCFGFHPRNDGKE
jgi:uncharacterized protein YxeA